MANLSKTHQHTAAVIAYEGALSSMPWSSRQWIAEAFADAYQHQSRSFNRHAFIEACKRESEKDFDPADHEVIVAVAEDGSAVRQVIVNG